MKGFRYFVLISLILACGLFGWSRYFRTYNDREAVILHDFPKEIGPWEARDLPISEREYEILETRNVFIREYTNRHNGKKVFLFIVYSGENRKVSHPPEICYTGGGATILKNTKESIDLAGSDKSITANNLELTLGEEKQFSFYWFKAGRDRFTSNYWKQQGLLALNALTGRSTSSALIRVSSEMGNNEEETLQTIRSFIQKIVPFLYEFLP